MKSLMESLDWKPCGYHLVADVGRWRLTVTRGDDVGYYVATWCQRIHPLINLPAQAAQGATWSQRNLPHINLPAQASQGDTAEEAVRLVLEKAKDHTAAEVTKLREFLGSMEEYL